MSVTVTQELTQQTVTVTGNPVENNATVTVLNARGPAGPTGEGGVSTFAALTDKVTANLPTINTPLSSALSGKAATSHTHTASQISDSTATGRSLLTAATQSDARTTALGSGATGDALFTAANAGAARTTLGFDAAVPKIPITFSNSSDFTTASTSFVGVTGLSFPVASNKNYKVDLFLSTNKNDSAGMAMQLTGPASPTRVFIRVDSTTTGLGNGTIQQISAFSSPTATFNTVSGDGFSTTFGRGIIQNGANNGTVQVQIRAVNSGTAKIYAGSTIVVTEL